MKKILYLSIFAYLISCDDGDLQIETLDFDSASIQVCDDNPVEAGMTNVLFKLNDTEALILELPLDAIKNELTTEPIEKIVDVSGPTKITYRTFSDKVSKNYFCDDIPLTEPRVQDEIIAEGGSVFITTVLSDDSATYQHTIELSDISLVTSKNERITDLNISNFGTVSTLVPEPEEEG